jgi:hypothetical protein
MFRNISGGYILVQYKWILLTKSIVVCFLIVACFAIFFSATHLSLQVFSVSAADDSGPQEEVIAPAKIPVADVPIDATKAAVMKWMKENSDMPDQILSQIYDEASNNTNTDLVLAICRVESSFNPNVRSNKDALGLMGVRPSVWANELKDRGIIRGRRDLYLVPNNLMSGAYVIEKYLARSENLEEALYNYVGGDSEYVRRVLKALGEIYLAKIRGTLQGTSNLAKTETDGTNIDFRAPSRG